MISNTEFTTYIAQGELEISTETPFIRERVSLDILAGTATYVLPDYAIKITRVTWRGVKCFPLDEKTRKDVYQGVAQYGESIFYSANLNGPQTIRFQPTPSIPLPDSGDPWSAASIKNNCIVEFFRTADSSNTLPEYLRTRMMRHYVGMRAYLREGVSQNLKASMYHREKWKLEKKKFVDFLYDVYLIDRKLALTVLKNPSRFPFKPILPTDRFGQVVNDEY